MGWCKKDVTPVLMHWSYNFLALTHQYRPFGKDSTFSLTSSQPEDLVIFSLYIFMSSVPYWRPGWPPQLPTAAIIMHSYQLLRTLGPQCWLAGKIGCSVQTSYYTGQFSPIYILMHLMLCVCLNKPKHWIYCTLSKYTGYHSCHCCCQRFPCVEWNIFVYKVHIFMSADALAPYVTRTSAVMILTM